MSRRYLVVGAVAVVALAGAYAAGRASVATQVEVREVVREVEVEKVVEVVREVKVEQEAKTQRVIVYRDRVIKPDGEVREREVERTETDEEKKTRTETDESRVEVREVVREVEVVRVEKTPLPDWRVGGLVGLDVTGLNPVYGARVDYRVAGPLTVGAWGVGPVFTGGIAVGLDF